MIQRHLNSLAVFAAVVDEGGFKRGAAKLRLSPSVASHHIAKLEDALGVELLRRSTRGVALTDEGRALYDAAAQALAIADAACARIVEGGANPVGALRLAMPAFPPDPRLEQAIWSFVERHPGVSLAIFYTDRPTDLVEEKLDAAFRVGPLPDSALKSRKLLDVPMKLVASPSFLARSRAVKAPPDLAGLDFISLGSVEITLRLSRGAEVAAVQAQGRRVLVDAIPAARSACLAGLGIMWLPDRMCRGDLAEGRLVEVLPQWSLPRRSVHALWRGEARRNSLLRRFIDFVADALR